MQTKLNQPNWLGKLSGLFFILTALLFSTSAYAKKNKNTQSIVAEDTRPTVEYVCGGNTGRSPMAEWYTRDKYGKKVITFSRGSGINPNDEVVTEPFAKDLILKHNNATYGEIDARRGTPANILEINKANVVLAMTLSHKQRLINMIDRECTTANLDLRKKELSDDGKAQWDAMCSNNGQALKSKIHSLIDCATGDDTADGGIEDALGKPYQTYVNVRRAIKNNIDIIMKNSTNNDGTITQISCIK